MLILPSASSIVFQAVIPGSGASGARLDVAYLEFVNGPAVPPPDIDPVDAGYYDRLAAVSDRDYLRCPVLSHTLKTQNDKTVLSLSIVSDGESGVHGKPFSATAGSRIYGLALAASRSNKQDDILFSRHYYLPEEQPEKPEIGHIMLSLDLVLP